jgi:hypothetical protein
MSQTNFVKKIKAYFYVTFSPKKKGIKFEIMCKNNVQMTIWRMLFASRILKATNTHPEYVILIDFPEQQ